MGRFWRSPTFCVSSHANNGSELKLYKHTSTTQLHIATYILENNAKRHCKNIERYRCRGSQVPGERQLLGEPRPPGKEAPVLAALTVLINEYRTGKKRGGDKDKKVICQHTACYGQKRVGWVLRDRSYLPIWESNPVLLSESQPS